MCLFLQLKHDLDFPRNTCIANYFSLVSVTSDKQSGSQLNYESILFYVP